MSDMQENGSALLTSADYTSLNNQIKMFKNGFSASNFGNVYNFKTSIDNKLLELYEELALEQVSNGSSSFHLMPRRRHSADLSHTIRMDMRASM